MRTQEYVCRCYSQVDNIDVIYEYMVNKKGIDMKMWKYWGRRYKSESGDDDEERERINQAGRC